MKDKRIDAVKNWHEPNEIFRVFIKFAKFYLCFIKNFSKIGGSLNLMLRTSSTIQSAKNLLSSIAGNAKIGGNSSSDQNKTTKR